MLSTDAPIRAGLIFQQRDSAEQLKRTLREAGIDLAVELDVDALRAGQLDDVEVEVYIVNLESEIEDLLDEVTELLDATVRPVVYNDAGVSSDLSGWDQARWARHLAAKIRKGRDTLPPAPAGSQAIPSPQRSPGAVPAAVAAPAVAAVQVEPPVDQGDTGPALELENPPDIETPGSSDDAAVEPAQDRDAVPQANVELGLDELDLGELDLDLPEAAEPGPKDPDPTATDADSAGDHSASDFSLSDLDLDLALDDVESDEPMAVAEQPGAPDSVTDSEPDLTSIEDFDAPGAAETAEHASEGTLPASDADLELGLDLPDELFGDQTLQASAAGGEILDDLDDLSAFDEVAQSDADLLEVLDGPDDSSGDAFDADDLESLFDDDMDLSDDTAAPVGHGNKPAVGSGSAEEESLGGFEDSELGLMLDELPEMSGSDPAGETIADLDELFAAEPAAAPSAPPELLDTASTDTGGGFSLPDISEWVLEPLDDDQDESGTAAVMAPKAESDGLDLRNLDSPTRKPAAVAETPPQNSPAPVAPQSRGKEGDGDDLASLDMGIDFIDFDLAPEATTAAAPAPTQPETSTAVSEAPTTGPKRIVILGASIGGPDSIRAFLKDIKPDLQAAFVLVQHMGAEFLDLMAQQLDRVSPLRVHLASQGRSLNEGEVLIAPVGKRLKFDANAAVDLTEEAGSTAYSPSIDQVLSDSLQRWGADRMLVIIFSGMANDAVAGARQLAAAGVPIWAQDPASCVISSMVDGVVAAKVVSFIGTPEQLAAQANRLLV